MKNIRNFCIIAHIDHGKSTLSDRILELTGTVEKRKMKEQLLDQMDLERERGITIKMTPVKINYRYHIKDNEKDNLQINESSHFNRRPNQTLTQTDEDSRGEDKLLYEDITYKIRGAAFKVKKELGLGHKESVYHKALEKEFLNQELQFESEKRLPVKYQGEKVGSYQPDFVIEDKIIIELKALPKIGRPQQEQLWSYLKGGDYKLAMLINFGSTDIEFKRIIYDKLKNNQGNSLRKSELSLSESAGVSNQIQDYVLNLIDTPGHVDFGYEVSRSLAAVEGAVLLVDSTKGVQAQTLSNLYLAIEQGLEIIPVMNKIDLPNSDIEKTKKEIIHILGCKEEDILKASGKTGEGVDRILEEVVNKIPAPTGDINKPLRALIFDSKYDTYKGVLADVRIVDGEVKREDKLLMMATGKQSTAIEVGSFNPDLRVEESLRAGEIGYIATGFKSVEHCKVGDTVTVAQSRTNTDLTRKNADKIRSSQHKSVISQRQSAPEVKPLEGYKEVCPMVYASFYPLEGNDYNFMRDALGKLKLNDAAFVFEPESNPALGRGFRCGFLGMLHLEIIQARLEREFELTPTITTPSVVYKIKVKNSEDIIDIYSPIDMPDPSTVEEIMEPYVKLDIVTPAEYMGSVMELLNNTRSEYRTTEYIDEERVLLGYNAPLTDVIINFHDELKSASSGFASMNYELIGYRSSNLVKMDILVAEEKVDAFSRIVPKENSFREGKSAVKKLKEAIPRQNFAIAIQATLGGKVVARETVSAFRKDVTAGMYGGDITRKNKLLDKQKKGKKKMKNIGRVAIPPEAFLAVLKK